MKEILSKIFSLVMKEDSILVNKPVITLKKFGRSIIYSMILTAISILVNIVSNLNFDSRYAFLSGIIIGLLQSIKKSFEKYDKRKNLK